MNTLSSFRKNLLRSNASFLIIIGGIMTIADYVGYRRGLGPLGPMLHGNDLAVGMQEAHGLAFLFGLVLFIYSVPDMHPSWHLLCAGIHVLLGGSNLIYWNGAIKYGIVGQEILVTTIHGLLVVAHLISFVLVRGESTSTGTMFESR